MNMKKGGNEVYGLRRYAIRGEKNREILSGNY
jgi:hypothetical protein